MQHNAGADDDSEIEEGVYESYTISCHTLHVRAVMPHRHHAANTSIAVISADPIQDDDGISPSPTITMQPKPHRINAELMRVRASVCVCVCVCHVCIDSTVTW